MSDTPLSLLHRVFGYSAFRGEQAAIVDTLVAGGDALLAPKVTRTLIEAFAQAPAKRSVSPTRFNDLTEREREVAVATGHGLTNAVIGERLYMSPATVKQHLGSVQQKLGVGNRVGVAVLAERAGLLAGPGVR